MNKTLLNKLFKEEKLDIIFSMSEQTRLWYSGIQASAGFLVIKPKKATLVVDSRYIEYATKNAVNVDVVLASRGVLKGLETTPFKRIGIEEEYLTIAERKTISELYPKAKLIPFSSQSLRAIKDDNEIKLIKHAASISLKAINKLKKKIKPGVTELALAIELENLQRKFGASKGSFDAIVVSGKRGALPHGQPSTKKLQKGELVTIDFGAIYKGYCSDITRTFHVGTVKNEELLTIERVLREAQKLGVAAVKPGVTTNAIDKICRDYITEAGYGEFFVHSTGHGLGIDVHEKPNVTRYKAYNVKLKPGMVITVEPGIYIEDLGGIRVEDDVLVTKDGHEVLSR